MLTIWIYDGDIVTEEEEFSRTIKFIEGSSSAILHEITCSKSKVDERWKNLTNVWL